MSTLRSGALVAIALASGALAGLVHGGVGLVTIGPYLDDAIALEFAGSELELPVEYGAYRDWQRGGQVVAGAMLGTSMGALFGIVYGYLRGSLPGGHDVKRALVLGGVMFAVLFLVPFLKYPASPPGIGDADDLSYRSALYIGFTALSGASAIGFYILSRALKGRKKLAAAAGYVVLVAAAAAILPGAPAGDAPGDLLAGFRAMSVLGMAVFWIVMPLVFGALWHKFRPDKRVQERAL
ncbi:conserved hypothetical protein [Cenarchaeum symbiosum A]|uniref:CbtA family protein n=1 Tax=Cenarchaeum symbiosum (strain A) TaxID=414004 RepID=A0RX23_CENSY|nr:conserved hypothetical protein [Cenarchaeum symbiosum A]